MTNNSSTSDFGIRSLLGHQAERLTVNAVLEDPLVVHGPIERLAAFAGLPTMLGAEAVIDAWDGLERTGRAWSPAGGTTFEIYPTKSQLRVLYDAGCTIVLEGVERFVPNLRPLCRSLERDLDIPVGTVNVEVFCTKRGGHSRPHFDPSFTFSCQIVGTKKWQIERHSAVQHPTFGMFLGRTPTAFPECHEPRTFPSQIQSEDVTLAQPGTVVFLPPGVLHETRSEGESYGIAFAIEVVDSIASRVLAAARQSLNRQFPLRAGRFGPQFSKIDEEVKTAATLLRQLANDIETWSWREEDRFSLRDGLTVEGVDETHVAVKGGKASKTLRLDVAGAALLVFAADHSGFSLAQVVSELSAFDVQIIRECVRQFTNAGLLQQAML